MAEVVCVIGDATGESNHAMRARICITKKGRIVQCMVLHGPVLLINDVDQ